jgi:hypothetical protein
MFQRGLQTISWKADDEDDGDRLTTSNFAAKAPTRGAS